MPSSSQMRTRPRRGPARGLAAALVLAATVAATVDVAAAAPAAVVATPASTADLQVSPDRFVGGQAIRFTGSIGAAGVRKVRLQRNLGRPGDTWKDVEGSGGRSTDAAGRFDITFPAPAMFDILFRVAGEGGLVTPAHRFRAQSQEVTLRPVGVPLAGVPFTLLADTTPTDLLRRPDLPGPVLPGRGLTLERREITSGSSLGYASPWSRVAAASVDLLGQTLFVVTEPRAGTYTYRVRLDDWTEDGDRVGWFPGFPTQVRVGGLLDRADDDPAPATWRSAGLTSPVPSSRGTFASTATTVHAVGLNAGQTLGWVPALWDFDWPYGESLTTKPFRGTRLRGGWLDTGDGTGRADLHNGALMLDSQRENKDGPGDRGTTRVMLRGQPAKFGRWEGRLRMKSSETNARDYRTLIELVPNRASDYACGARTVTVADLTAHGSTVRVGATSTKGAQWSRAISGLRFNDTTHHFAVEMSKRHISWFIDGRVVATLKGKAARAAVPRVPMTLRYSLVGDGDAEMNRTQAIVDWFRGFPISTGSRTTSGASLKRSAFRGGC